MKKIVLVILATVLVQLILLNQVKSQYGSWILPDQDLPNKIVFEPNGLSLEQLTNTEYSGGDEKLFSSGSFDEDESLYFYIIGHQIINNATGEDVGNITLQNDPMETYSPELEIIKVPGSEETNYFVFYARYFSYTEGFCFTKIDYSNFVTSIDYKDSYDYIGGGYGAFAISKEREDEFVGIVRDIYYCCADNQSYGLRKKIIDSGGVSGEVSTLANVNSHPVYGSMSNFAAYNMEMEVNDHGDVVLAWIIKGDDEDHLFMYNEDTNEGFNVDMNHGRITGIEFSQVDDEIIYLSCYGTQGNQDNGIYKYNYTTPTVLPQKLPNSDNYNKTYLEAGKDGHIYAVLNTGTALGRINEITGQFSTVLENITALVTYTGIGTTQKYYILPEYSDYPHFFDLNVDNVTIECPGDCTSDLVATPTNGEIEDYTWVWKDENQVVISETNVASDLCEGEYTVEATHTASQKTVMKTATITLDPEIWDFTEAIVFPSLSLPPSPWENETFGFARGLTIESGSTLELVNTTLEFAENTNLIIEPGAMLIVDNSTLTTHFNLDCPDLWSGVHLWGSATSPQNPLYQGLIRIINGGAIENAVVGIRTIKVEGDPEGGQLNYNFTGGIVQAIDANFVNNRQAIYFLKYPATGYSYSSSSFINISRFETNEDYPGSVNPDYFVKLNEIKGVRFQGCEFINNTGINYFQSGIYSYNSQFSIDGYMQGLSQQYSVFDNLLNGIYAIASNPNRHADIRHTHFDLNFKGVYISGMTNARVTSNIFNTNAPYSPIGGYGMYLNSSTGYWVEDNDFLHEGPGQVGVGLIVCNSGTNANEIYNNRFSNLVLGISAQEQNGSTFGPPTGLQILCNDFDVCTADVLVPRPRISGWGIAPNQGANGTNPTDMAGNLFYLQPPPYGDFDDINNQGRFVTYYYPLNTDYENVEPKDYTHNTILIVPKNVEPDDWTPENGCPSGIEGGGGGGRSAGDLKALIVESELKIDSTESLLALLVDGGSTDELQDEVEYSFPPEAMALYTELVDNSPYLSDTVVSTAIEKEEVLPAAMIRDVMVANPHTAKSDDLMNKLDERWTPLPEYMKEQILQGKNIVSVMEKTESKLGRFKLDKARAINELERIYRRDSIAGSDSLVALYNSDNELESKYKLAFISMEQGAWNTGMAILESIPGEYELSPEENTKFNQMAEYAGLISTLQGTQPDSTAMTELTGIMESEQGTASVYALNTLLDLGAIDYEEPIEMPEMLKSTAVNGSGSTISYSSENGPRMLKLMPNPAKDYIIVEYSFGMQQQDATVEITDMAAKPVYSVHAVNVKDQLTVDTRKWKRGVYLAVLRISGKTRESVKFTITD
jgi:hypothetical protein